MATKNTAYFVTAIRQITNTESDPIVSDQEIVDRASEGKASLYDLIIGTYEHYAVKKAPVFTLASTIAGCTALLPTDFYKDVALTYAPTTQPQTVHRFSSYVDRNNLRRREYMVVDNYLQVGPYQIAAGQYELAYTPLDLPFAEPIVVTPHAGDSVDAFGNWFFTNASFDSTYVGATMTITPSTLAQAGVYVIDVVTDSTHVHALPLTTAGTFGVIGASSFQFSGTVDLLPQIMAPWYEYIQVHAAIAIKNKIEQDATELMQRLAALTARIEKMAANRMEEGGQIAMPREGGGFWDQSNFPGGT